MSDPRTYITIAFFIATGEPPLCMAVSVLFALRNAIDGARENAGDNDWYRFGKKNITLIYVEVSLYLYF